MNEPRRAPPAAARESADSPASGSARVPDDLSFENALERLEAIVDRLERGELELEASLSAFEEGVALSRRCAEQLESAERRIETLVRDGDGWAARPFETEDAGEETE